MEKACRKAFESISSSAANKEVSLAICAVQRPSSPCWQVRCEQEKNLYFTAIGCYCGPTHCLLCLLALLISVHMIVHRVVSLMLRFMSTFSPYG